MPNYAGITEETLEAIQKAQTSGVTSTTGIFGYDLSGVVSLVPVNTPTYDRTPRKSGDGSQAAHWRALLNINNQQPNPFVGLDQGGNYILIDEQDVLATYQPVRVSGFVSRDAVDLAKNYADAKAIATVQTLMQWRIQENKAQIGGQAYALPASPTPTVTITGTTGGTIAASATVHVKIAARSGLNYYWGGSNVAGSAGSASTTSVTSTNVASASWAAVQGAVAYDVWVAASSTYVYYTTVTTNTVTITSLPTVNQAVPSLPDLYTTAPTAIPTADTSFSTSSYNGYIASILGDYSNNGPVTPGSGTPSGATWTSLNGATLTANAQGVTEIDNMLLAIYNAAQLSPTAMIMNGQEAQDVKAKILASNQATMFLDPTAASRNQVVGGGSAAAYINGASGGDRVEIVVDPHMPPGRIMFVTDSIPYPNSGIANTFEARCLRDVSQFDYGPNLVVGSGSNGGPRDVWDVSSTETFVNRAPVACGLLTEIAAG